LPRLLGMVPANDNQQSPTRELLDLTIILRPLWAPSLVVSLLAFAGLALIAWG
jgi:hypothetical protein